MNKKQLSISDFYNIEAEEILSARRKSFIVHHSSNIRAAGDIVEKSVRNLINRKLPIKCKVTSGHIVDSEWNNSSQFDVILANAETSSTILKESDECEYVSYESIYGFGEIKSTYRKSEKQIEKFITVITDVRERLKREKVPANYMGHGIHLNEPLGFKGVPSIRNPLLKFMFFVKSESFDMGEVLAIFKKHDPINLPDFICFMDQGFVFSANVFKNNQGFHVKEHFSTTENVDFADESNRWMFMPFGLKEERSGASLAFLISMLDRHIRTTVLYEPNLFNYYRLYMKNNPAAFLD